MSSLAQQVKKCPTHVNVVFDPQGNLLRNGSDRACEALASGKIDRIWAQIKHATGDDCILTVTLQGDGGWKWSTSSKVQNRHSLSAATMAKISAYVEKLAEHVQFARGIRASLGLPMQADAAAAATPQETVTEKSVIAWGVFVKTTRGTVQFCRHDGAVVEARRLSLRDWCFVKDDGSQGVPVRSQGVITKLEQAS